MQEYIVYMGSLPEGDYRQSSLHLSLLQEVTQQSSLENLLVRSYKRSFNGFSAKLTKKEAESLASREGVVSVFPGTKLKLQTTRSWDFMGFSESLSQSPRMAASDIVVGVIDGGIWPELESFSDEGFGAPPAKWKGACKGGLNFTCNKKVIGARYYSSEDLEFDSARDSVGHGTDAASIAAGNIVRNASFFGVANGSARGGLPSSRIAAYKVCGVDGYCPTAAILAAFDDAIADGVDLITVSISPDWAQQLEQDVIAIGAFHAMGKGILTLQSAGNGGPDRGTIGSVAPWIFSVAASTTDRLLVTKLVLGNNKTFIGNGINSFSLNGTQFPLIHGKAAAVSDPSCQSDAAFCYDECLDTERVRGKILVCDDCGNTYVVANAGAIGTICFLSAPDDVSYIVPLPAVGLSSQDYDAVEAYENSTKLPRGEILKSEGIQDSSAPIVASFSSRGPNMISQDILKPDISAPGVDILAAFPPTASPTDSPDEDRSVKFSIVSGTSAACPHVAGVAAYVKASHPDWSPSAIKSAIMTTAWPMNNTKVATDEFDFGSGHINPVEAINPGLVYETSKDDYVQFLCSVGYDAAKLKTIMGGNVSCPTDTTSKGSPSALNYPSMVAKVPESEAFKIVFNRTVTNVGVADSNYKAQVVSSPKLKITVVPQVLSFKAINEKQSFTVTVDGEGLPDQTLESASLVWSDGKHNVRSPLVVHTVVPDPDDY
ncbi:hypothetical protein Tsubulata_033401 [Turnera subulata]|uniref:Uncharacterized protein n=1 Tax=Turnera subulata TaxID=218843 RepID=A0A9Q0GBV0_9ROSI|nr:hypothetical protein Tsubulata_033401 [Turnera subulata]